MTELELPKRKCFIATRETTPSRISRAIHKAARIADYDVIHPSDRGVYETIEDVARADIVLVDLDSSGLASYIIGAAQAMGKQVLVLCGPAQLSSPSYDVEIIFYHVGVAGAIQLEAAITQLLQVAKQQPFTRIHGGMRASVPFFIDWDRLAPRETDNLCRELLFQMGYRQVDWATLNPALDLIAELPKKDPDGYEYRELWLVSIGKPKHLDLEMISVDPEYFLHRITRDSLGRAALEREPTPPTLLYILLQESDAEAITRAISGRYAKSYRKYFYAGPRIRVWNRAFLTQLVQQFPQLGYKYFSDSARSSPAYRKSQEELYSENVQLSERLALSLNLIEEEKGKRITAERDAIWKDISFSAAHKIGNPLFAIETNLKPLKKRIAENQSNEALIVIDDIAHSVEKAKNIVNQFKSLAKVQRMRSEPVDLLKVITRSCEHAREAGISCHVEPNQKIIACGDDLRLAECFDELLANSQYWWKDGGERAIKIEIQENLRVDLPLGLEQTRPYHRVIYKDTGKGIQSKDKERIFDAFFTSRDQGTGLGLALVRRIIEGHGGLIFENGVPGDGARFEIFLPAVEGQNNEGAAQ